MTKAIIPQLISPISEQDWKDFHAIRRTELFEARGRADYDANHPDDKAKTNFPLLLKSGERAVGTVRLDLLSDSRAAVRLVAITKAEQEKGFGKILMSKLEELARSKGVTTLMVNSAPTAVGFYEKLGFVPRAWEDPAEHLQDAVQMIKEIS